MTIAKVRQTPRAAAGNPGDVKAVGAGVCEMRIFVGKGYRLYFIMKESRIILLLCGGDKSSQPKDIEKAKTIASKLR